MKKLFIYASMSFCFLAFFSFNTLAMNTYVATDSNNSRTLSAKEVGDSSDWIEIARCNGCSLILRVQPLANLESNFRYTNNGIFTYRNSNAWNKILEWYFARDNLKPLKEHAINCDAERKLGYLNNSQSRSCSVKILDEGISLPSETGEASAFLLSYQEIEKYLISENYEKFKDKLIQKATGFFGKDKPLDTGIGYLRTQGRNPNYVSCNLFKYGNTDLEISQTHMYDEKPSLRPALWVKNSIFEKRVWSQVEYCVSPLNAFVYERELMSWVRDKLTKELISKEQFKESGKNLHMLIIGGKPNDRYAIADNITRVYNKAQIISGTFLPINESNFSSAYGSGVYFFDTEKAQNTTYPPRVPQTVGSVESSTEKSIGTKLLSLMDKKNCVVILGGSEESKNRFFEINPELREKFNPENTVNLNKEEPYSCMVVTRRSSPPADDKPVPMRVMVRPKIAINHCLAPFRSLVGMDNFKSFIRGLIISENQRNIDAKYGIVRKKLTLHMIITGNPGTGKTTVVKMLGKILFDAGLIEREDVISVERADLVDSVVGGSEALTKQKLAKAKGGILFIDEAYALTDGNSGAKDNDFGRRVIEGLLNPLTGDDCVIILAGYPDKMKQFVDFNPGLTRRFAPDHRVLLPDYTSKQLFEIFNNLCVKCNLLLEEGSENLLIQHFEVMKRVPNFGNAGYAERLFEKVMKNRDFDWQEIMGEDCDELMDGQITDRRFIKLKHVSDAIREFESSMMI